MAELIWDGKYDEHGNKRAPVRIELPFQTVETVNESVQERQRTLELSSSGHDPEWRNRLIWGDKKYVLPSLLPEFAGKVDLIYIDPPFSTSQNFSYTATLANSPRSHDEPEIEFDKQPSVLEQKAYRDTWGVDDADKARGVTELDRYLRWLNETLVLLRELLSSDGSIFVHLDVHMGPYVKALMDEVFGPDNFQNEIAWYYYNKLHDSRKRVLPKAFDQILYYVKDKSSPYTYAALKEPREKAVTKLKYKKVAGKIQNVIGEDGKAVTYESTERTVDNVWRIRCLQPANLQEWVGYQTQKPIDLIERILSLASKPAGLVMDCFVGSGSSVLAAEKLNRRWIACDLGRFAIHTTRKRLLGIPGVKPFIVQNLGKYERQQWQVAEFPSNGKDRLEEQKEREANYRKFILELYHATPVSGHAWLHGVKAGRMVHVAAVDAPVTRADVNAIAAEVWKSAGKGANSPQKPAVDILGWEFALELNETAKEVAAQARVDAAFKKIPREVLEKKAVEQGDVHFFELGALSVATKIKKRELTLTLSDFVIPLDDVPAEVRSAIKHWSQMVDYWAVDWDFKDDTFHNQWQSYRTRKNPKLDLSVKREYPEPGHYTVVVKVIDILGNDTTKTLTIEMK
jgi:adenine-specific DNA-methyltransferase